jgi:hypothetical protein
LRRPANWRRLRKIRRRRLAPPARPQTASSRGGQSGLGRWNRFGDGRLRGRGGFEGHAGLVARQRL